MTARHLGSVSKDYHESAQAREDSTFFPERHGAEDDVHGSLLCCSHGEVFLVVLDVEKGWRKARCMIERQERMPLCL